VAGFEGGEVCGDVLEGRWVEERGGFLWDSSRGY
jgi:hypothetical protein